MADLLMKCASIDMSSLLEALKMSSFEGKRHIINDIAMQGLCKGQGNLKTR
ncbi:hypothetical protein KSX_76060 [Ktedonospora formicarum]|uniref:Uncharacterized protein n=1 Tax=Ktedonospora formicarum TaxID=2778364 RepID=A0A8J3IBW0_9CHLR|nr:hypothetical protein KSX_76060 [Ktedonospora formicarum]